MNIRLLFKENPFVLVFISLILFLIVSSLVERALLLSILFSLTLITGLYASFEGKPRLNFGIVVGFITIIMTWSISLETNSVIQYMLRFVFFFAFVSYVCYVILKKVITSKEIDFNLISGAVSVYILIALLFSFIFSAINYMEPDSFRFPDNHDTTIDFIYFSYVTITTLGYGEITPVSPLARSISVVLALLGQLYLTILVAILVSKFKGWKKLQKEDKED